MAKFDHEGPIHLETEADAWELYERLVEGRQEFQQLPKLTVGEWAKVDVYIPSARYDSAITPYMMGGWVELQRAVYRAFSVAHGGDASANKLSDAEKDRLELVVKVQSGSSDQTVDVQAILNTVATSLVDKMEPTHILIAVLTLILTLGGRSALAVWLGAKKDVKLAEIDLMKTAETKKEHLAALSTIAEVAGVERARAALLAKAGEEVPAAAEVREQIDKGREALVRHVTKNDAVVNGIEITSQAGRSLTARARVDTEDVRLDGLYKIRKVDTTAETGFRVHLSDAQGSELVADVAEVMTTLQDREVIKEAEWSKVPVYLQINGRSRRDQIIEAVIVRARPYDPDTDGDWR